MIVDIFIPCYIDQLYPNTAANMVKVLEKLGCAVNYNIEQTCCGMPAFHNGQREVCREVAEKFIRDFNNDRYIVTPSPACTNMVKNYYPEMFHNTSLHLEYKQLQRNVTEFTDFLVNVLKTTNLNAKLDGVATYLDSCVSEHECAVRQEPRTLLANVQGLTMVEMAEATTSCGFGGFFSVKHPEISLAMLEDKIHHILETGAEYVISSDMGCLMHVDSYIKKQQLPLTSMHIVDVLATGV